MDLIDAVVATGIATYLASAALLLARAIRGPTLFDRILAVDALSYDLTVFMALVALHTGRPVIAGPMILLSLWAFTLDLYTLKFFASPRGG